MANLDKYRMSKDDQERLDLQRVLLVQQLMVTEDLLSHLLQTKTLSNAMASDIRCIPVNSDKAGKLLDILKKRGPDAMSNFLIALEETDQSHLAAALRRPLSEIKTEIAPRNASNIRAQSLGNGSVTCYSMSDVHKEKLRVNRVFLIQNIMLSEEFLGYLIQSKTINTRTKDEIMSKPESQRVGFLLDCVPKAGPLAFANFVDALRRSEQEFIANMLEDEGNNSADQSPVPVCEPEDANNKSDDEDDDDDPYIHKEIQTVTAQTARDILKDSKNVYKMTSRPRGIAFIVNNISFSEECGLDIREGAEFDTANLCEFLEKLGFQTEACMDGKLEDVKRRIDEILEDPNLASMDSFVLFALSHGREGILYDKHGQPINIRNDLERPFYSDKCPQLKGKPKLFFIQACRSGDALLPLMVALSLDHPEPLNDPTVADDFFRFYPTISGHEALRHREKGSLFVRQIIKVFSKHACRDEIRELSRKVSQKLKLNYQTVPEGVVSSTKKLYFLPGYNED